MEGSWSQGEHLIVQAASEVRLCQWKGEFRVINESSPGVSHATCLKYSIYTCSHNYFVLLTVKSTFIHSNQPCSSVHEGILPISVTLEQYARDFFYESSLLNQYNSVLFFIFWFVYISTSF